MDMPHDPQDSVQNELPCHEKIAFATREQAEAAAAVDAYRYAASALKAYVCRYCGMWHLSSH